MGDTEMQTFEEWADSRNLRGTSGVPRAYAEMGWNARQPEIDALKADNAELLEARDARVNANLRLADENVALKAEVERLRADADLYGWLCQKAEFDHDYMTDQTWIKFPWLCRQGRVDHTKPSIDKKIADSIRVDASMKEAK
jgi:hypothetical protein